MANEMINKIAALPLREREETKKRMVDMFRQASRIRPADARKALKLAEESDTQKKRREEREENLKLTRDDIRIRAHEIRALLENYGVVIAAVNFDILTPDSPWSLNLRDDRLDASELAVRLNPTIDVRYKWLEDALADNNLADYNLGPMKWALADTAFAIGVLAGAIFTGSPEKVIDKLERGLVHAISSRPQEVRD